MNGSLFEDFRRMQDEIDQLFGRTYWPTGIRAGADFHMPTMK